MVNQWSPDADIFAKYIKKCPFIELENNLENNLEKSLENNLGFVGK